MNEVKINKQEVNVSSPDVIRCFFISEFEKDLENQGIDTVCFMGYGYDIAEVKVGAQFYFSYLYYGRMADLRGGTVEKCLRAVLSHEKCNGNNNFFDRYKIIQKYKYFNYTIIDYKNKKTIPAKQRREYVKIKNLRTNEITVINENDIDYSYLFCWVTW